MSPHNLTKIAGYIDYSETWLCWEDAPWENRASLGWAGGRDPADVKAESDFRWKN